MIFKKIVLTLLSVLLISVFLKTELYNKWLTSRVLEPYESLDFELENMSERRRKEIRYGLPYGLAEVTDSVFKANGVKNAYVLFTPNSYIRQVIKSGDCMLPEPSVFYYFVGRTGIWTNSPLIRKTNWAILADKSIESLTNLLMGDQQAYMLYRTKDFCIVLVTVSTPEQLDRILAYYKNYPAIL